MGQPVQPVVQACALSGTGGLDVPLWGGGKKEVSSRGKKGDAFVSCQAWGFLGPGGPLPCGFASAVAPACRSARSQAWRWACPACWQTPAAPHPAVRPPAAGGGEQGGWDAAVQGAPSHLLAYLWEKQNTVSSTEHKTESYQLLKAMLALSPARVFFKLDYLP